MGCGSSAPPNNAGTQPVKLEGGNQASPPTKTEAKQEPKKVQEEKKEVAPVAGDQKMNGEAPAPQQNPENIGKVANTPQVGHKEPDVDMPFPTLEAPVLDSIFNETAKDNCNFFVSNSNST